MRSAYKWISIIYTALKTLDSNGLESWDILRTDKNKYDNALIIPK
jgi:hypothetical protein